MISTWAFIGSQAIWVFLVLVLIRRNDTIRESFFMLKAQNELKSKQKQKIPSEQVRVGHGGNSSCGYGTASGTTNYTFKDDIKSKVASLEAEKNDMLVDISTLILSLEESTTNSTDSFKEYAASLVVHFSYKNIQKLRESGVAELHVKNIEKILAAESPHEFYEDPKILKD